MSVRVGWKNPPEDRRLASRGKGSPFGINRLRGSLMKPKWQKLASLAQEICTL